MNYLLHLIWIVPTVMVVIIIASSGWRPSQPSIKWGKILKTVLVLGIAVFLFTRYQGCIAVKEAERAREAKAEQEAAAYRAVAIAAAAAIAAERPTSGERFVTKDIPLRVYMDPRKIHARGSGPAHYVNEAHPTFTFDDYFDGRRDEKWWNYPAGWYLVSPLVGDEIYFRWWQ